MSFTIIFTNVLWYFEFFVFAVILVLFFFYVIYVIGVNSTNYNKRFDMKQKSQRNTVTAVPKAPRDKRPFYCDPGCIWYTRLVFTILTIGVCYVFAYTFIYDTKLRFGLFL